MREQVAVESVKVTYVKGFEDQTIKHLAGIIRELTERIDDDSFVFDTFDNSNRCKHCKSRYPDHKESCTITALKERMRNL